MPCFCFFQEASATSEATGDAVADESSNTAQPSSSSAGAGETSKADSSTQPTSAVECDANASASATQSSSSLPDELPEQWFELVGVVVHSGQANAGHYYSFIKERQ